MKELSIEEKAKAYDKLFVKAQQIYNKENDVLILHTIEDLFPEFKESEDERIRKELIDIVKKSPITFAFEDKGKVLAWLEKQGEQKSDWSEEDEEHIHSLLDRLEGMCKKGSTFITTRFAVNQDMDWLKSLKQRIGGEQ